MPHFLSPHDDHHLDALLASCAEEPWNIDLRLILADWLEEHGDPRAELYRLAAQGSDIAPWLRRWGDDWLGQGTQIGVLHHNGESLTGTAIAALGRWFGGLSLVWDQRSMGKGASLLEEGWINGLIARGDSALAMVGAGKRLSDVHLYFTSDISRDALQRLRDLPALRALGLRDCSSLSNHGVEAVCEISSLKAVDITRCTRLTNASLQSLCKLPALERLTITGCRRMSKKALSRLSRVSSLRHLDIASLDWLTDEAAPVLSSLSNLEHLDVRHCPYITDALIDTVAALPRLKSLAVGGTTVLTDWTQSRANVAPKQVLGDAFFRYFLQVFTSQVVDIQRIENNVSAGTSGVTRQGLLKIAGMQQLEKLDLQLSQQVDDDLLHEIAKLPRLRRLNLGYCEQFTASGLAALAHAPNLRFLTLMGTALESEEVFYQLGKMQNLRVLDLSCRTISLMSVGQLRTQLPYCDIRWP